MSDYDELCEIDVVDDLPFSLLGEEHHLSSVQAEIPPWRLIEAYQDEKRLREILREWYED